jgi:probable rRNA maturation factor
MIEVEILGTDAGVGVPEREQIERLCLVALASASIRQGHVAIEFVDERRITELNGRYRGKDAPTDVLSFPIDGLAPQDADQDQPLELGDVVICPAHTTDVAEAVVHGTLHLVGMDHETDDGQMLALQRELLEWERRSPRP